MGMSIGKCIGKIMDSACYHIRGPSSLHPLDTSSPKILSLFLRIFHFPSC